MNKLESKIKKERENKINYCIECKKDGILKPVWKGKGKHYSRNYWKLYCKEHQEEF